VVPLPR